MKTDNKFLRALKRFHLIPKIVCLLFAFIFWIYVMEVDSPDYEDTFEDVPVTVVGTTVLENDKNLAVFSGYDTYVDITVRGQKSVIAKYSVEDIEVRVDVSEVEKSGMYSFELFYDLPSGITLIDSSAKEINMFIDRRSTANVSVEPVIKSYKLSSAEYTLGDVTSDTDTITVTGPESVICDIDKGVVEINMGDEHLTQSLVADGNIVLKNQNGETVESKYLKLSKSTVTVSIPVYTFKELPLRVTGKHGYYNSSNSEITVEPRTVKVKGETSILKNLDFIDVTAIDEKKISADTEFIVDISLPESVYAVEGEPTDATVSVDLKGFIVKTFVVENIKIINAGDADPEILDKTVAVKVMGDKKTMDKITEKDITLVVDFSNFKENVGIVNAAATVEFDVSGGIVYEIGVYSIQVQTK